MYTLKEIEKVIIGEWHLAKPEARVSTILQDSRKLEHPESTLFFAIKGEKLDGHDYIEEMYAKGIRNFIVQNAEALLAFSDVNYGLVANGLTAIQNLAAFHRQQFHIPVVAITGSNGKTIVKEWCHQVLQNDYTICRSPKSFNSQLGVPLSVWRLNSNHNLALFEAGVSEPDEMDRLQKIIQPTIGIFTTIGSAHSENFISITHKIKEKLKLFLKVKVLIYCSDLPILHQNITAVFGNQAQEFEGPTLLSWGQNEQSNILIISQNIGRQSTVIKLTYLGKEMNVEIPFIDYSSLQNAMHSVALMLYLKLDEGQINERLSGLQRVAMRLEQKEGINNSTIINDSYNSDIDSLKIALDFLQQQKHQQGKTVILSDILQSGMTGVDLYTAVNELLLKNEINRFIAIGENLMRHQFVFKSENFSEGLYFFNTTKEFIRSIHDDEYSNETILLKGARKFEFELINAALEEKAHATVLEIDLNAVIRNFKLFTSKLKPNTKIMVMVKAFSYGVSSIEIAKLLEFHGVDYLGVAYADEGVTLRKAGVQAPIMVLNPEERSFTAIIKYDLEPEIYSFELLKNFSEALERSEFEGKFPVHIDLDTGMKRLGFEPEEIDELIRALKQNNKIEIKSIFSHLAASDEKEFDEFTQKQINLFKALSTKIMTELNSKPLLHLANSSGISRFRNAQFDMVRLGIGLYGFNEELNQQLEVVAQLKTKISQIKKVAKGESIGYGRKGKATKNITIATIAIGYADGFNRLLSNGVGEVYLCNKKAPVIGNICMDMSMLDITHIPEAKVGDAVEIFGEHISANEIAKKINTIPYEILTSVSERVKRVFYVD
jgi:alanine racemase